jgi:hypothetical protein
VTNRGALRLQMQSACLPPSLQAKDLSTLPLPTRSVEAREPTVHCTCCPVIIVQVDRVRDYLERVFFCNSHNRLGDSTCLQFSNIFPTGSAHIPPSARSSNRTLDFSSFPTFTTDLTLGRESRNLPNESEDNDKDKISTHSFSAGFLMNSVVRDAGSLNPRTGTF